MNIAYYAPMKPPSHPTPSGDRSVARLLVRALAGAGCQVHLASRFRSYDGSGCDRRQAALERRGLALAGRVLDRLHSRSGKRPDAWFTYHVYHKAPDWIGPAVSGALGIPYLVAEASHAVRQSEGPWRRGYAASVAAIRSAAAVIGMNPADRPGVEALGVPAQRIHELAPFVDARRLRTLAGCAAARQRREALLPAAALPTLVTVAMMRAGDKLDSYRLLAAALARLVGRPWRLLVVGGGPAADEVHALFAHLPPGRVRFAGEQPPQAVPALVHGASAMVWPACNEAWGMVFLEAAALGVPSVAGAGGGVASVVDNGRTGRVVVPGNAEAMAGAIAELLDDRSAQAAMGRAAASRVARRHDLPVASARLAEILARSGVTPR